MIRGISATPDGKAFKKIPMNAQNIRKQRTAVEFCRANVKNAGGCNKTAERCILFNRKS